MIHCTNRLSGCCRFGRRIRRTVSFGILSCAHVTCRISCGCIFILINALCRQRTLGEYNILCSARIILHMQDTRFSFDTRQDCRHTGQLFFDQLILAKIHRQIAIGQRNLHIFIKIDRIRIDIVLIDHAGNTKDCVKDGIIAHRQNLMQLCMGKRKPGNQRCLLHSCHKGSSCLAYSLCRQCLALAVRSICSVLFFTDHAVHHAALTVKVQVAVQILDIADQLTLLHCNLQGVMILHRHINLVNQLHIIRHKTGFQVADCPGVFTENALCHLGSDLFLCIMDVTQHRHIL